MNDNQRYILEVPVDDFGFEYVNRFWPFLIDVLRANIEQRSKSYPNCTQRFVLLNEIRKLFGRTLDEDGWTIGRIWNDDEAVNMIDLLGIDIDNPIGVVIYVNNMTKLDESYQEMTFLKR